nr:MAG TPA: Protein of unknown function (DUF1492) [Caudoviricetes sp.]DAP38595.1 MAG TPA: Protein of unknown function (DUF1492) [Caudoviricetes sp.]
MRAKDFLRQVYKLDRMVENKLAEKRQWQEIAAGATPQTTGERVQSSGNPQRMADAISRYIDIEQEIDECIDKLVDTKREVIGVIEQLNATEYDVLHKMYIQGYSLQEVADMKGRSYSWMTSTHGRALQNVQRIIDKRKGL